MRKEMRYICQLCGNEKFLSKEDPVPDCCGGKMTLEPLDPCTGTSHSEMSRNIDEEGPCDDGRGGKI